MSRFSVVVLIAATAAALVIGMVAGILIERKRAEVPFPAHVPASSYKATDEEWHELRFGHTYKTTPLDGPMTRPLIVGIRFVVFGEEETISDFGQKPVTVITREEADIEAVRLAMVVAQRPIDDSIGVTVAGGGSGWGYIDILRNDGNVTMCGLTPMGFAVNSYHPTSSNTFKSPDLAQVIAYLYERETGEKLPATLFQCLSGTP